MHKPGRDVQLNVTSGRSWRKPHAQPGLPELARSKTCWIRQQPHSPLPGRPALNRRQTVGNVYATWRASAPGGTWGARRRRHPGRKGVHTPAVLRRRRPRTGVGGSFDIRWAAAIYVGNMALREVRRRAGPLGWQRVGACVVLHAGRGPGGPLGLAETRHAEATSRSVDAGAVSEGTLLPRCAAGHKDRRYVTEQRPVLLIDASTGN